MVDRMGEPAVNISPLCHPMYVQGYTAALQDVEAQLTNIEEDLRLHKRRQNAKTFRALVRCMTENRTALREIPNAFIRCNNNAKDGFELWWEGRKNEASNL